MTTKELAAQVVEQLRGTPFVLALLVINVIVLLSAARICCPVFLCRAHDNRR